MIPIGLLPDVYAHRAFIAGGFAACPAQATDCDVWVAIPKSESLADARARIVQHLQAKDMWSFVLRFEPEDDGRMTQVEYVHYDVAVDILKVGHLTWTGWTIPIHIMVFHETIQNGERTHGVQPSLLAAAMHVIDAFDVSTHAVALVPDCGVVRGEHWTPVQEPPVALRDTANTPARMDKIRKRFSPKRTHG